MQLLLREASKNCAVDDYNRRISHGYAVGEGLQNVVSLKFVPQAARAPSPIASKTEHFEEMRPTLRRSLCVCVRKPSRSSDDTVSLQTLLRTYHR